MADKDKFPTEEIELPSEGKVYSKDSPLSSGKIDIKYMTAKEEDILTSQNLIKKGVGDDGDVLGGRDGEGIVMVIVMIMVIVMVMRW